MMVKKLELQFFNEDGKTVTYTLEKPIEPVDPEDVNSAMDEIIEQNAFTSSGGDIVEKKGARLVEHIVSEIEVHYCVLTGEKRPSTPATWAVFYIKLRHWKQLSCKTKEGNALENWISFVTEVGFPIAVTFYLLHRIETKLNLLIESIHALPEKMK